MKKYIITIEETISDNFEIEANTAKEAMKIAENRYSTGEYTLAPGNLVAKQMAIMSSNGEAIKWIKF